MCSQNELNILMTKIAEIYRQVYGENIFKILLYGSQDAESDVDVVAIVRGNRADLQKKLREVWTLSSDLELEYETVLSPTVIPFDEYEEYREVLPYYRNIEREGVSIVA